MADVIPEIPEIPDGQRTPLVEALLAVIYALQDRTRQLTATVQELRDEVAVLKRQKPQPKIAPSRLNDPPPETSSPTDASSTSKPKRPGSAKKSKNAELIVTREEQVNFPAPPPGAVSKGYEAYMVQELVMRVEVIRYWRERIVLPNGQSVLAPLPSNVLPGQHFGTELIAYILHQYHHNHVTAPLLHEELTQRGVSISTGQLNRILVEEHDLFHAEKAEVLASGLQTASYIQTDDTGARHDGHNGYCTQIGNEFFAHFTSTDSKSRLNFLALLRGEHRDFMVNEVAIAYWKKYELSATLIALLIAGPDTFASLADWQSHLKSLGVSSERVERIATEGAMLGSVIAHGLSPELVVLSDGAGQFNILQHAACWVHAERPLARMIPHNEQHRQEIERIRGQIWELYQALKAYQQQPRPEQVPLLTARFETLCQQSTAYPSIRQVLKEMRRHQTDLLRVLSRPEVPLHNNASESDIRDYVKKRKISGGTRSDAGKMCRDTFASLKKTCRKLGIQFCDYLRDRLRRVGEIPRLADLIRQRAATVITNTAAAVPP